MPRNPASTIVTVVVAFGVTVVLTISVLAMLPSLVRADRVKARLEETVKAATGHDLTIGGTVTVSLLPSLSVHVTDVALHSPPGFAAGDLLRAKALDVELELLPLLSGRAKFDRFVLLDPALTLEVDHQGQANWALSAADGTPQAAVRLGNISVTDGTVTYVDDRAGTRETAEDCDLTVSLASLDAPLSARGTLSWHKRPVTLALDLAQPRVLADGTGASPAMVSLESGPTRLAFSGAADAAADRVDGDLDLSAPSLQDLALWITGKPFGPPGDAPGKLSLKASLITTPGMIALRRATLALGPTRVTGDLSLTADGARPAITGTVTVDGLDLAPWLPPAEPEWSTAPMDASALRAIDLDLGVTLDGVAAGRFRAGPGTLALALHDGRLSADLTDLGLYGGTGRGRLALDASGADVGLDATLAVEGMRAGPLLAAAGFDRLTGTASASLHLAGRGASPRQLVASLAGDGKAALHDGAIEGIDLAALSRRGSGKAASEVDGHGTAIADLTGSWTVAAGIATGDSLVLRSPELQLDGSGSIDLPDRTLSYRLVPQPGEPAAQLVPLVVEGPWANPSVTPAPPPPPPPPVTRPRRRGGRHAAGGGGR